MDCLESAAPASCEATSFPWFPTPSLVSPTSACPPSSGEKTQVFASNHFLKKRGGKRWVGWMQPRNTEHTRPAHQGHTPCRAPAHSPSSKAALWAAGPAGVWPTLPSSHPAPQVPLERLTPTKTPELWSPRKGLPHIAEAENAARHGPVPPSSSLCDNPPSRNAPLPQGALRPSGLPTLTHAPQPTGSSARTGEPFPPEGAGGGQGSLQRPARGPTPGWGVLRWETDV